MLVCVSEASTGAAWNRLKLKLPWLLFLALASFAASGVEHGWFAVRKAVTELREEVFYLHAQFDYELSDTVKEALRNGVPLTVVVSIRVERWRWYYLWNANVASLRQKYQLNYHPLTRQYTITNLNSSLQHRFPTLYQALDTLRELYALPLLDKNLVDPDQEYSVELKTYLDIEALPAPLRPVAYFSKAWRLQSNTYVCPLKP